MVPTLAPWEPRGARSPRWRRAPAAGSALVLSIDPGLAATGALQWTASLSAKVPFKPSQASAPVVVSGSLATNRQPIAGSR